MIQIISYRFTQQIFMDTGVDFYSGTKFHQPIKDVYVAQSSASFVQGKLASFVQRKI